MSQCYIANEDKLINRVSVVSFTPDGCERGKRICEIFDCMNIECQHSHKPESLKAWTEEAFKNSDAIIFVCAMGIAVRSIAPYIVKKTTDPAVIVMDDMGRNIISVLSGHIGGANNLTNILASRLGANPVITTSSDVHGRIAIDSWAVKNNLVITDMAGAKAVAAEIVAGRPVGFYCDGEIQGKVPEELILISPKEALDSCNNKIKWCLIVSDRLITHNSQELQNYNILQLIPRCNVLGMGCKKDKAYEDIRAAIDEQLERAHIDSRSIFAMASIDVKKNEEGLLKAADYLKVPISFYTANELENVAGSFPVSDFVQDTVGVDNVCERAAIVRISEEQKASREDNLIINKTKCGGITFALAKKKWSVIFE